MGRERLLIIAAFFTTYFVWGATYLANYWAIGSIPPFLMGGSRFFVAGCMMYAYTIARGDRSMPGLRQVGNAGLIGLLFLSIGTGGAVWAQQFIPTSTTALIISFEPLVVMTMMWGLLDHRPPLAAFFGAAVSICGMALLISEPVAIGGRPGWGYGLAAIATGMLCWAIGMLLRPRLDLGKNRVRGTGMQMIVGGALMLPFSYAIGEWEGFDPAAITQRSALAWCFLVIFGSIAAFSAFNYLLERVSAEKVATNTYVNPVVAVLLGGLFNNEIITGQTMLAGAVLLAGVYFINSAKRRAQPMRDS